MCGIADLILGINVRQSEGCSIAASDFQGLCETAHTHTCSYVDGLT